MPFRKYSETARVPLRAILDADLLLAERTTLAMLHALVQGKNGFAPVTADELGELLGVSGATARRHLRTLEKKGYARRGHRFKHPPAFSCPRPDCFGVFVTLDAKGKERQSEEVGTVQGDEDWRRRIERWTTPTPVAQPSA